MIYYYNIAYSKLIEETKKDVMYECWIDEFNCESGRDKGMVIKFNKSVFEQIMKYPNTPIDVTIKSYYNNDIHVLYKPRRYRNMRIIQLGYDIPFVVARLGMAYLRTKEVPKEYFEISEQMDEEMRKDLKDYYQKMISLNPRYEEMLSQKIKEKMINL